MNRSSIFGIIAAFALAGVAILAWEVDTMSASRRAAIVDFLVAIGANENL
jgi:hypothetical protein